MLFAFSIGNHRTRAYFQDANILAIRKCSQPRKYFLVSANLWPPDIGRREVPIKIRGGSNDKSGQPCLLICILIKSVSH